MRKTAIIDWDKSHDTHPFHRYLWHVFNPLQDNKSKPNIIVDMSFAFSIHIIKYVDILESDKKYVIARQSLKSGTSIGANIRESQNAESKPDFIHKMKIATKEADETAYWLMLCNASEGYPDCCQLIKDCDVLVKILSKMVSSSKSKIAS